jgi:hypothetical protein
MSTWTTFEAEFTFGKFPLTPEDVLRGAPTGSESGNLHTFVGDDGTLYASGNLRDMGDYDTPTILAWWCSHLDFAETASLTIDVGNGGPRYRYRLGDGGITKLRGILDA